MEIEKLRDIAGNGNLSQEPTVLNEYSGDRTIAPGKTPACVVRPENAGQVQQVIRWANETGTPIVPVSSGPPHFRGDTVPGVEGAVILDLTRMKKILRIDTYNRLAMVEPGVTFGELQPELAKEGLCAYTPLCPRTSKSVIGSMLEREPITMPAHHWDATDPMLCAEIVFGTGDKLRGGEAAGPDTIEEQWAMNKAQMTPMGLGQFNEHRLISGAQGTIGVVTWSTLKCRRLSRFNRTFLVPAENLDPLIDLTYRLMRIRLADHCFILNGLNLACLLRENPEKIVDLREKLPAWTLVVSYEGYGDLPEDKVRYQEADFHGIAATCRLEPGTAIAGVESDEMAAVLAAPSAEPYWKLRFKGGFQDIFFLTTLDRTPEFVSDMGALMQSRSFPAEDLGVYLQPVVQGTSCHCEFNLYHAPADRDESVKWLANEGSRTLAEHGAFFSRPYGAWAGFAFDDNAEALAIQRKVKQVFDPKMILNPAKLYR